MSIEENVEDDGGDEGKARAKVHAAHDAAHGNGAAGARRAAVGEKVVAPAADARAPGVLDGVS